MGRRWISMRVLLGLALAAGGLGLARPADASHDRDFRNFSVFVEPAETPEGDLQVSFEVAGATLLVTFEFDRADEEITITNVEGVPEGATVKFRKDEIDLELEDGTKIPIRLKTFGPVQNTPSKIKAEVGDDDDDDDDDEDDDSKTGDEISGSQIVRINER